MCLRGKNALGWTLLIRLFLSERAYKKNNKHRAIFSGFTIFLCTLKIIHRPGENFLTSTSGKKNKKKLNRNRRLWSVAEQTASTCAGRQMLGDVNRPSQKCFYMTFPVEPDIMLLLVSALANSGGMCESQREAKASEIPSNFMLNFDTNEDRE